MTTAASEESRTATALPMQEPLTQSSVAGAGAAFLGLLIFALGAFILGVGTRAIPADPADIHAPMWVLSTCGVIFALPGLTLIFTGARGAVASRRRRDEFLRRPEEPWLADRAWDERGEAFTGLRRFLHSFLATVFLALFLLPFHWWAFLSDEGPLPVKLIVGLFDLFLVFAAIEAVRRFLAMVRYGRSEVVFDSFPFFIGEEVALRFRGPRDVSFRRLRIALQCIEERIVTSGTGKNRFVRKVPHSLWVDALDCVEGDDAVAPVGDLPLRFRLPADLPGNRLGDEPPTYWQLLVTGEAAGPDYEGRFLLPVYERPVG